MNKNLKEAAEGYADVKTPLRIKDYSSQTKRVYNAFIAGAEHTASLVDEFLRLHPEYRCLDVIGKFQSFIKNK